MVTFKDVYDSCSTSIIECMQYHHFILFPSGSPSPFILVSVFHIRWSPRDLLEFHSCLRNVQKLTGSSAHVLEPGNWTLWK